MSIIIFLTIIFSWFGFGLLFISLQGAELKQTQIKSLETIHFITLSDLFNHSRVFDELEKNHEMLYENLVSLMFAYKKNISLEDISTSLEIMKDFEREQVLDSLRCLLLSNSEEYKNIARLYMFTQATWLTYFEVRDEKNWKCFIRILRYTISQNLSTRERLENQIKNGEISIKRNDGFDLNYDYSVAY